MRDGVKGRNISRRGVLAAACAVVGASVGLRVKAVNDAALRIPEEIYDMDEWLDMADGYLSSKLEVEATTGYGFKVTGARIMTPNEYVKKYAQDGATAAEGCNVDDPSVCVVDLHARNLENPGGHIKTYLWRLVPEEYPVLDFTVDTDLLGHAVPALKGTQGFTLPIGKEVVLNLPFCYADGAQPFQKLGDEYAARVNVPGSRFRMTFTNLPVRKIIKLEV